MQDCILSLSYLYEGSNCAILLNTRLQSSLLCMLIWYEFGKVVFCVPELVLFSLAHQPEDVTIPHQQYKIILNMYQVLHATVIQCKICIL